MMSSRSAAAEYAWLVVRFQHSHSIAAGTFADVGIKGPLEIIDSSGALDLTFAFRSRVSRVANVKSAPLVCRNAIRSHCRRARHPQRGGDQGCRTQLQHEKHIASCRALL